MAEAAQKQKEFHVIPANDGWDLKTNESTEHHILRGDALLKAKLQAKFEHGRVIVHKEDGSVEQELNYAQASW